MTTAADIIAAVRVELNDTDPDNYRWSDEELLRYINAGRRQVVTVLPEARVVDDAVPAFGEARFKLPARGVKFLRAWNKGIVPISGAVASRPYAYEFADGAAGAGAAVQSGLYEPVNLDVAAGLGATILAGTLREVVITYEDWPPDEVEGAGAAILSGSMRQPIVAYESWPPDAAGGLGALLSGGSMIAPVVTYGDWPPDTAEGVGAAILGGLME